MVMPGFLDVYEYPSVSRIFIPFIPTVAQMMTNKAADPESDPKKRDEVLKRMLKMPPKPHRPRPQPKVTKKRKTSKRA